MRPSSIDMCMESTEQFSMEGEISPSPPGEFSHREWPVVGKSVMNTHRPSHSALGISNSGEFSIEHRLSSLPQ
jgi:hypothetical protein